MSQEIKDKGDKSEDIIGKYKCKDNNEGDKHKDFFAGAGAIDPTDPAAAAASKLQPFGLPSLNLKGRFAQ